MNRASAAELAGYLFLAANIGRSFFVVDTTGATSEESGREITPESVGGFTPKRLAQLMDTKRPVTDTERAESTCASPNR